MDDIELYEIFTAHKTDEGKYVVLDTKGKQRAGPFDDHAEASQWCDRKTLENGMEAFRRETASE